MEVIVRICFCISVKKVFEIKAIDIDSSNEYNEYIYD